MDCKLKNNYLDIANTARVAIDTLIGFYEGEKLCDSSKKGIEIIAEVLYSLKLINSQNNTIMLTKAKYFETYDKIKFLKDICDILEWNDWESDLSQWLTNKENVLNYFIRVEGTARGRSRR